MIPWMVARELRATLLDYLRSTWSLADRRFEAALFAFLSGDEGMFQGPYLRLGLPFAPAPSDVRPPLEVLPPYAPHLHQLQAWQRLSSRGRAPEATLITTGTGSGKTECFLYPLLDHAYRERAAQRGGIKAIVLYPMNALAADQAGRFAAAIHADERLCGRLRVGLFVGGEGRHREMGQDHVVDDNDKLRSEPPDILLTNYRMLDLLLQRPKDARLWRFNEPETLRYLVLDEIHTYDGAQGTDVACLIRRLAQRLSSAEAICPVGTSATVGNGGETRRELLRFASTLFDQELVDDAFIGETRLSPRELLPAEALPEVYPSEAGPWPLAGDSAEAHVKAAAEAWLPPQALTEIFAGEKIDRVALGHWVLRLPLVHELLRAAHDRPRAFDEIATQVSAELSGYAAAPANARQGWVASALSLLSYAEREAGHGTMPLVNVQATLWVRELRRLLCRVGEVPAFRFHDESPPPPDEAWLPRYACRDCGQGGWLVTESGPGDRLGLDYTTIAKAFGERAHDLRLLHDDASLESEAGLRIAWLDARQKCLLDKVAIDAPRVLVFAPDDDKLRCPGCGGLETLRIVAARSTTLSSVAVGHLFTTPLNTDRKLLTFSDSVQDAAHRAGFFGARTYRFSLRSAILAAVPRDGRLSLAALGEACWAHGIAELEASAPPGAESDEEHRPAISAEAELTARLLPSDLHWLGNVVAWHDALDELVREQRRAAEQGQAPPTRVPEPSAALVADLKTRLRWECVRELGVAARIGRTLEQSGCASVTVEESRFAAAVRAAEEQLQERLGLTVEPGDSAVAGCLAGVITRLRLRGGIFDPLLTGYIKSAGSRSMLSKQRAPLLSPFPAYTTRPLFLTNAPKARHFDSVASARPGTWAIDWLSRSLGVAPDAGTARDAYALILDALVRAEIVMAMPTDEGAGIGGRKATAWGLRPDALEVSRAHVVRRCRGCGHDLTAVAESPTDLLDHVCLRFRCGGKYEHILPEPDTSGDGLPATGYYRRFYERGKLGRLWSQEHTGLLARADREALELEFKLRPRPDSPNLLSCTPTLEMGIDIGDLSATLLCSVPPSTANYVQRVGRAGRKTGNALVLAFAATRPHDLHFFQQPLEAMAGTIQPPGCYLRAPEVLKRQALAFCFDGFARDGGKLGGQVGDALKGKGAKAFPQPILEYVSPRRETLRDAFVELFGRDLDAAAKAAVAALFDPDGQGLSPLEATLQTVADQARARREALRKLVQDIDVRLRSFDDDEEAKKLPDIEEEKARLFDERSFSLHQLRALREMEIWQWLCEESCLPNFAFPERGVKLDAFIRREGTGSKPEHHSWVRAPAAALRELAPFNAFYASARRVEIGGVELKRQSPVVTWRFCRSCHHAEPHASLGDAAEACPKCSDGGWSDVGQFRQVIALAQVFAVARHRDAVLGDDGDERQRAFYETVDLFEPGSQARDAWASDALGFGFELQPKMCLRQLNLGPRPNRGNPGRTHLAGHSPFDVRFVLCDSCGHAQLPPGEKNKGPGHRAWCPERRKAPEKQSTRAVHLMRELRTEALRMVVPLAAGSDVEAELANLRAALRLGLRRLLGGEPDFLDVYAYDEPLPGREGRRRYLVVLDRVPGGTGMLAELCRDKGAKLKETLERTHDALMRCECREREPAVKACYQCLYAYRLGNDLPLLDRSRALELVEHLLAAFGSLARVDTVGTMSQSRVLESELEERFVVRLRERVLEVGGAWERIDDGVWKVGVASRRWVLKAQVELTRDQVVVPCRADFVFYPENEAGARAVAVFTDGLAYHVMPEEPAARLADDAQKRHGVSQGGAMLTWSLTWKDVVSPQVPPVPRWLGDGSHFSQLQAIAHKLDEGRTGERCGDLLRVLDSDPLDGLVAYLGAPSRLDELARIAAFSLLQRGKRQRAERVQAAHQSLRTEQLGGVLAMVESEGDRVTAQVALGEHARLLVDIPSAQIGALATTSNGLELTLRLEDDPDARASTTFEASWRLWLRAWNLLQVLPSAAFVTRASTAQAAEPILENDEVMPIADDPRLAAVAEILDEDCAAVVRALLERHRDLEAPRVPLELRRPTDDVDGDLELGWPGRRVAAYFDAQRLAAEALEAAGWTVFAIEKRIELPTLARALGLEE